MLLALTVWQPWAWALAAGHKPIENRGWAPPKATIGKPIAIHAAKRYDMEAALHIKRTHGLIVPPEVTFSAIIAVGILDRLVHMSDVSAWAREVGRIGAAPYDEDNDSYDPMWDNPWFSGEVGWVFRDVVQIEPVPCRGAQKLWAVRDPVLTTVRERYREAKCQTLEL